MKERSQQNVQTTLVEDVCNALVPSQKPSSSTNTIQAALVSSTKKKQQQNNNTRRTPKRSQIIEPRSVQKAVERGASKNEHVAAILGSGGRVDDEGNNGVFTPISSQKSTNQQQQHSVKADTPSSINVNSINKRSERSNNSTSSTNNNNLQSPPSSNVAKTLNFNNTPADSFRTFTPGGEYLARISSPTLDSIVGVSPAMKNAGNSGSDPSGGKAVVVGSPVLEYSTLEETSPSYKQSRPTNLLEDMDGISPDLKRGYPQQRLREWRVGGGDETSETMEGAFLSGAVSPSSSVDSSSDVPLTDSALHQSGLSVTALAELPTSPAASTASTSTTATTLVAQANTSTVSSSPRSIAKSLGPSEYALQFPAGVSLHLKLEPVVHTLGRSMGCCVAGILPEFGKDATYMRSKDDTNNNDSGNSSPPTCIQVNDLVVSINGISVLSRKHSIIIDLLHQFHNSTKTIVFRSLEKVWKSQFQSKTMRNIRSGRRVATAINDMAMERKLSSWVETPTKLDVEAVGRRMNGGARLSRINEDAVTPSKQGLSNSYLFSPSNVRKVLRVGSATPTKSMQSPSSASKDLSRAKTAKKSNISKNNGNTTSNTKKSLTGQIGKVLVGEASFDDSSSNGFECVLRLKKDVLTELNHVRMDLVDANIENRLPLVHTSIQQKSSDDSKENNVILTVSREKLLKEAINLQARLQSKSNQFVERFVDIQMMLRDETVKSSTLKKELELLRAETTAKDEKLTAMSHEFLERTAAVSDLRQKLCQAYVASQKSSREHEESLQEVEKEFLTMQLNLNSEISELRAMVRDADEERDDVQQQISKVQAKLEDSKKKNEDMEQALAESQQSKSLLEANVSELTADLGHAQEEAARSSKQYEALLKVLKQQQLDFDEEREDFNLRIAKLEESVENGKKKSIKKTSSHMDAVTKLAERIAVFEVERDEARGELEDARVSFAKEKRELKWQLNELNARHEEEKTAITEDLEASKKTISQLEHDNEEQFTLAQKLKDEVDTLKESEAKLSERVNGLQTQVADGEVTQSNLRSDLDSQSRLLAEKEAELSSAISNVSSLESKIVELAQELNNGLQREKVVAKIVEAERAEALRHVEALENLVRAKNERLVSTIDALETERSQLIDQIQITELEVAEGNVTCNNHKAEITSMSSTLQSMEAEITKLHDESQQLQHQRDELNDRLSSARKKRQTEKEAHCDNEIWLADEIEELKASVEQEQTVSSKLRLEVEALASELAVKENVIDSLTSENHELQSSFDALTWELSSTVSSLQAAQSEVARIADERDCLASKVKDFSSELQVASDVLKKADEKQSHALDTLQRQIGEGNAAQVNLRAELELAKNKLSFKSDEFAALSLERTCLETRLSEETQKLHNVESELASATSKHATERNELFEQANASQAEFFRSQVVCAELRTKLEEAERLLDQSDVEIQALSTDCDRLETQVNDLNSLLESKDDELQKANTTIRSLQDDVSKIVAVRDGLSSKVDSMDSELTLKDAEISDLENQLYFVEETTSKERAEYMEKVVMLEMDLAETNSSYVDLCSKSESQRAIISELSSHNDDLKAKLDLLSLQTSDLESQAYHDKVLFEASQREHLNSLQSKESEIAVLSSEKEELQTTALGLNSQIQQLKTQTQRCEEALVEKQRELDDILSARKEELASFRRQTQQREETMAGLRHQNHQLVDHLKTAKEAFEEMQSEKEDSLRAKVEKVAALELDKEHLQNSVDDLGSQIELLELQLQTEKESFETRHHEVEALLIAKDDEIEALESGKEELKRALDDLGDLVQQLEEQLQVEKESHEQLQHDMDESLQSKRSECSTMSSEKQELQGRVRDLCIKVQQLEERSKMDRESFGTKEKKLLESVQQKETEISSLSSQNEEYNNIISSLKSQINSLEAQLQSDKALSDSLKAKETEVVTLVSMQNVLNSTVNDLKRQILQTETQLRLEKESYDAKERQLLRDNANLQNSIAAGKIKHTHLMENLESTQASLKLKEADVAKLTADKEALATEVTKNEDSFKAAKDLFVSQIEHLERQVECEQGSCTALSLKIESLTSTLNVKMQEVELLRAEGKSSKDSLESQLIETREKMLQREISSRENEEVLLSKLNALSQEATQIEQSLRQQLQESSRQLKEQQNELLLITEAKADHENTISELLEEKVSLLQKVTGLSFELETLRVGTDCTIEDLQIEKSSLADELASLNERIGIAIQREDELAVQAREKDDLLHARQREIQTLHSDLQSSKLSADVSRAQLLESHKYQVDELMASIDKEREGHQEKLSELTNELQSCRNELDDERARCREKQALVDDLRLELKETTTLKDTLSSVLHETESLLHDRISELDRLKEGILMLEENHAVVQSRFRDALKKTGLCPETMELEKGIISLAAQLKSCRQCIDEKQALIDEQCIALIDENKTLRYEADQSKLTEKMLRSMLHSTHLDICQFSMELACTKGDVMLSIAEVKKGCEEAIATVVHHYEAKKVEYQRHIKSLGEEVEMNKLMLACEKEATQALAQRFSAKIAALEMSVKEFESAQAEVTRSNIEMASLIQRHEGTITRAKNDEIDRLCHLCKSNSSAEHAAVESVNNLLAENRRLKDDLRSLENDKSSEIASLVGQTS